MWWRADQLPVGQRWNVLRGRAAAQQTSSLCECLTFRPAVTSNPPTPQHSACDYQNMKKQSTRRAQFSVCMSVPDCSRDTQTLWCSFWVSDHWLTGASFSAVNWQEWIGLGGQHILIPPCPVTVLTACHEAVHSHPPPPPTSNTSTVSCRHGCWLMSHIMKSQRHWMSCDYDVHLSDWLLILIFYAS